MLIYVCFLGPKTKFRVIWIKFYKKIRIRRTNTLGLDGRNFSLTYFYNFYTSSDDPEENWTVFRDTIHSSAMDSLGPVSRKHQDWFDANDEEIQGLLDEKQPKAQGIP